MALLLAPFNNHLSPGQNTMLSLFHLIFQLNKRWSLILTPPISCWISLAKKRETDHGKREVSGRAFQRVFTGKTDLLSKSCSEELQPMKRLYRGLLRGLSLSCMQKCKAVLPGADGNMGSSFSYCSSGSPALQHGERASANMWVM